jgi:predicted O-methyltransferase YrrM
MSITRSGFGGLALFLARLRPDSRITGIEIAPLPWAVSAVRAAWRSLRGEGGAHFVRGDYRRLNFAEYDVIFAYLSPAAMPALWLQASLQMRPGTLLLSYEFEIPGRAPDFTLVTGSGRSLYGWRL